MEIFQRSRLSKNRKIIEEIKEAERGRLFEIAEKSRHFALRIYNASSKTSKQGIDRTVLQSTASFVLDHPNILRIYDIDLVSEEEKTYLLILYELASGNLNHWMEVQNDQTLHIAQDILQGLNYLHAHDYVHRRLTPKNIMMVPHKKNQVCAKLGDFFDLNIYYPSLKSDPLPLNNYDMFYASPELLSGYEIYTPESDMWSFGIILFEMVAGKGKYPFATEKSKSKESLLKDTFAVLGTPCRQWRQTYAHQEDAMHVPCATKPIKEHLQRLLPPNTDSTIINLIEHCLRLDPKERITAKKALGKQHIISGSSISPPKLQKSPKSQTRKDIIKSVADDVSHGLMLYYPAIMAIYLFDRCLPLFPKEDLHLLFATCYLLGLKLLTNTVDPMKDARGAVPITERNQLQIIMLEREIVKALKFNFFTHCVSEIPRQSRIFEHLEKQTFRCASKTKH